MNSYTVRGSRSRQLRRHEITSPRTCTRAPRERLDGQRDLSVGGVLLQYIRRHLDGDTLDDAEKLVVGQNPTP